MIVSERKINLTKFEINDNSKKIVIQESLKLTNSKSAINIILTEIVIPTQ